jgi:uncharacterized protein (TIGR03437 family)
VSSGALPAGLALNTTTGAIAGTPTSGGTSNFTITVTDARNSVSAPQSFSIVVSSALIISTTSLPSGAVSAPYAAQLNATGGAQPYGNWLVISGTLPGGLTLSPSSGAILGIPLTTGNFTFGVTVKDSAGAVSPAQSFAILIVPRVHITTTSLPGATVGTAYSAQLAAADGVPPYSAWTISAGTLPAGLTLNANTGVIGGTPTSGSGVVSFSVTVKDSAGGIAAAQSLSISFGGSGGGPTTSVLIQSNPPGRIFTIDGGPPQQAPIRLDVTQGQHTLAVDPIQPGGVGLQFVFTGWSDGGAASHTITVTATPATFAATFKSQYQLTTVVTPVGGGTITPASGGFYDTGTVVPISAAANNGYAFMRWTGSVAGTTSASTTVTMSGPQTVTAVFIGTAVSVAPSALTFSYRLGDPPPSPQSISVFNGGAFTVSARSDQNFLVATPAGGTTPAAVTVAINTANVREGTLNGQVVIALSATPSITATVQVTLTVTQPGPPQPQLSPSILSLSAVQGAPPTHLQLAVLNTGGGTLNFTAQLQFVSGSGWASLDNNSGAATFLVPGTIGITIDPSRLTPGTYQANVSVQDQTCNIILAVTARAVSIQISQTGLQFNATSGGQSAPPQTVNVSNGGPGTLNWTAAVQTFNGPDGWLVIQPGASTVTVAIDASQLTAGQFFGSVRISADGAANSPQTVTVVADVTDPAGATPVLSDAGALIVGDTTVPSPPPAQFAIANLGGQPLTYISTATTEDGANWVGISPPTGTLATDKLTTIGVQPNFAGLSPGVRRGTLRLSFSDGTVSTFAVASILPANGPSIASKNPRRDAGNCSPQGLVAAFTSLAPGFAVTGSEPISIRVAVADTCGTPLTSGGVYVRFNTGSNGFSLTNANNGNWTGTWTPPNSAGPIQIVAQAFSFGNPPLGGQTPILQGSIRTTLTPLARPDHITDNASRRPGNQIPLGSWASLFGDGMSDIEMVAPSTPYTSPLADTQVLLGGVPLPLEYVSDGQVNALIPRNLDPNTQHQIVVQRGGTISVPLDVTVADVAPGLYTVNDQGSGQALVLVGDTGLLAAPAADNARPAQRGETLMIYMEGLGPVNNAPPDGFPSPDDSSATTLATPIVTIGGAMAALQYSGLEPGVAGVYLVKAVVPDDAPSGDAVPLVVSVNDIGSNPATIAIQ